MMGEVELELTKKKCRCVIRRIEELSHSCKRTILKLVHSELNFLSRHNPLGSSSSSSSPISLNIGHLEAVVHLLHHPFITAVSRLCKPIPLPTQPVHVDIVCTLNANPVWIIVSDRNPNYVSWHMGLKSRVIQLLAAARSSNILKPSSIILFFSKGLPKLANDKLREEFGASDFGMAFASFDVYFSEESDDDWIYVLTRSYQDQCVLEIKVDVVSTLGYGVKDSLQSSAGSVAQTNLDLGDSFSSLISGMISWPLDAKNVDYTKTGDLLREVNLINFDTTALIALVSGISNGGTEKLLAAPEDELRKRFKGNYKFVIEQVMSEIQNPIHAELDGIISGKRGIVCETVRSEFNELVLLCGGLKEKFRAEQLLKCLMVVLDSPSERMASLPTTRKLALKNKVIFGTGDFWHAPTLTANMAIVRAIHQTGMSLFTIEHRPRALTGH